MQLIFTALQPDLAAAWASECGDLPWATIHRGSILDLACDAAVSPANSFGFMNGGIDQAYTTFFGPQLQERLQRAIRERHHGELLIGAADIVPTGSSQIPYLIAAPTMRMPQTITETVYPYLAARATLLLWRHGEFPDGPHRGQRLRDVLRRIAMPGLGTGVGSVEPLVCARQVRAAINDVVLGEFEFPASWGAVLARHEGFLGRP